MHTFSLRRARMLGLSTMLLIVGGCAAPESADPPNTVVGKSTSAVTASDAISRAEEWVAAKLVYCQSPNGADDTIDPSCSPVCHRLSNPDWDPYRSDCSGLISWAWELPAPGRTTAGFAPNTSDITRTIDASTLATGDAVNTDDSASSEHHIMLFKEWTMPGQEATFIEEPGCAATPDYAHEFTSTVSLNGTSITVDYNGITFLAIHYQSLVQDPTYAAQYVSQSWPLSNAAPIQMTVGQMQTGSIDLKNVGTATWKSGVVELAPIPRDQPSTFQAPSWISQTRVSTLAADVAPGQTGHFEWDLDPSQPGDFQPYFGLVAEGVTWFADSGGPPDNDIQVSVHVVPAPPTSSTGVGATTGAGDPSGTASSAGGGSLSEGGNTGVGGGGGEPSGGNPVRDRHAKTSNDSGGCQYGQGSSTSLAGAGLLAAWLLARRRRETMM